MKNCSQCNIIKPLTEFYAKKNQCKDCIKAKMRTYEGVAKQIYREQRQSCRKRPKPMPIYSEDEFVAWFKAQPNSKAIYDNWVATGYSKDTRPSADRLNNSISYVLNNLELVTWAINKKRGYEAVHNGDIINQHVTISQYKLDGTFVAEYKSIKLGADSIGLHIMSIQKAVDTYRTNGEPRTSGGYIWKKS